MNPGDLVRISLEKGLISALYESQGDKIYARGYRSPTLGDIAYYIPDKDTALYISSIPDLRSVAQIMADTRPYGMRPVAKDWHLIVWNGMPVWVISTDVHLESMV